jgi:hypothetical protein
MTTPSDIAHHAARARTDELERAAAAARCAARRSPRSTYRLNPWVARCVPPLPQPTNAQEFFVPQPPTSARP